MLIKVCLQQPGERATDEKTRAYQKWKKVDEISRCYILSSMSNVLQYQHQAMPTTYNMILSLKEIFGDQNCAARLVVMKDLLNIPMVEGTPMKDHVLKIVSLLNELEILGSNINGETQVDIIL